MSWSQSKHNKLLDARSIQMAAAVQRWLRKYARLIVNRELAHVITKADTDGALVDELTKLLIFFGSKNAANAGGTIAGPGWELPPQVVDQFLREKPILVQGLANDTREGITDGIRTMVREGLTEVPTPSAGEIARRIRSTYLGDTDATPFVVSSERAALIARTELAQAQNTGIVAGYDAVGAQWLVWSAYSDGSSGDRHHERMDGKRVRIGEKFVTPLGNELRYPADPLAPIKETANCRCTVTAEF